MANIKLGGTTVASESGGTVSLNSAVTNIPAAGITGTLGSGATFPAGHVLQTVFHKLASGEAGGQPSYTPSSDFTFGTLSTRFRKSITPIKNNSDILIMYQLSVGCGGYNRHMYFRLYDNTNTQVIGVEGSHGLFGITSYGTTDTYPHWCVSGSYLYENPTIASTPNAIDIEILPTLNSTDTFYLNRRGAGSTYGALTSTLTLMEIAG